MPISQRRQLRLREDSLSSPSVSQRVSQSGVRPGHQGLYCPRLDGCGRRGTVEGIKGGHRQMDKNLRWERRAVVLSGPVTYPVLPGRGRRARGQGGRLGVPWVGADLYGFKPPRSSSAIFLPKSSWTYGRPGALSQNVSQRPLPADISR